MDENSNNNKTPLTRLPHRLIIPLPSRARDDTPQSGRALDILRALEHVRAGLDDADADDVQDDAGGGEVEVPVGVGGAGPGGDGGVVELSDHGGGGGRAGGCEEGDVGEISA